MIKTIGRSLLSSLTSDYHLFSSDFTWRKKNCGKCKLRTNDKRKKNSNLLHC